METTRLRITTKDVQRILGGNYGKAKRLLQLIRKASRKELHHVITVKEFADYTGMPIDVVQRYLRNARNTANTNSTNQ
jgi:hypothetical protein